MNGIFLVQPTQDQGTQAGGAVAAGIIQGAVGGQLSPADQEHIFVSAGNTPAGGVLYSKNLAAWAALGAVAGLAAGYFLARRKR